MTALIRFVIVFSFAMSISGCINLTPKPVFNTGKDIYTGEESTSVLNIATFTCSGKNPEYFTLTLGAVAYRPKNGVAKYAITAHYYGREWAFIESGESFHAIINNTIKKFNSTLGSRTARNLSTGGPTEFAMWEVSREDIENIISTKVFQFRIIGSNKTLERCMDVQHRAPFGEFLIKSNNF